ncbi:TPA: phosphomannomutase [Candidatus Peregrinibacteria bacterium]|nr:phosphomannomutase [Candidatus Peregrinibacteria bacterium]
MIKINPHIFRAYDIRGIAMKTEKSEVDLTPELAYFIGKAAGKYLQNNFGKRIVVGRDIRITSKAIQASLINGLLSIGCEVKNIGEVTSPMVYWSTCAMDFDAGIMITASHNPKEYNGVKIVGKNAHSVCGEELQKILELTKLYANEEPEEATKSGEMFPETNVKSIKEESIFKKYLDDLFFRAKISRPLKIAIDAGNGSSGPFIKDIFEKFGCEVIPLYCKPDGNFPNHEANPEYEHNLKELARAVREERADIGFGFDGDGDRIGVLDENGKFYSGDYMVMFLAKDLLTRNPDAKIIFDTKASQVAMNEVAKFGGNPILSITGHSFIETRMREEKALLGGEISGHIFFAENFYGFDDAFMAMLKIMEIVSKSDKKFSEYFKKIPKVFSTPEIKAHCPDDKKFQIVKELTNFFVSKYECLTIDGVRVKFDENSWGAVRCSNTTPNLTLRFESPDEKTFKEIQKIFYEQLKKYPEIDVSWYK